MERCRCNSDKTLELFQILQRVLLVKISMSLLMQDMIFSSAFFVFQFWWRWRMDLRLAPREQSIVIFKKSWVPTVPWEVTFEWVSMNTQFENTLPFDDQYWLNKLNSYCTHFPDRLLLFVQKDYTPVKMGHVNGPERFYIWVYFVFLKTTYSLVFTPLFYISAIFLSTLLSKVILLCISMYS